MVSRVCGAKQENKQNENKRMDTDSRAEGRGRGRGRDPGRTGPRTLRTRDFLGLLTAVPSGIRSIVAHGTGAFPVSGGDAEGAVMKP